MIRTLRINLLLVAGLCALAALLGFALSQRAGPESPAVTVARVGETVSDFQFQGFDGRSHALADFTGGPVIVHFWATWCAPCIVEFPALTAYAAANPDVTVLAVSADVTRTRIERFLSEHAPDIPENMIIVHDTDKSIMHGRFGTFQLPETYILAPGGIVQEKIIGAYKDWESFQFLP